MSASSSVAPVVAGDLDYTALAGTAITPCSPAPPTVVLSHADRPMLALWSCSRELRSVADLRGKTVGLQNRGDTNELGLRLLLKQYGVDPRQAQMLALGVTNPLPLDQVYDYRFVRQIYQELAGERLAARTIEVGPRSATRCSSSHLAVRPP